MGRPGQILPRVQFDRNQIVRDVLDAGFENRGVSRLGGLPEELGVLRDRLVWPRTIGVDTCHVGEYMIDQVGQFGDPWKANAINFDGRALAFAAGFRTLPLDFLDIEIMNLLVRFLGLRHVGRQGDI